MKRLNKEQLQKIIDDKATEQELASFDVVLQSNSEKEPSINFIDNVIYKFNTSKAESSKKSFPPYFAIVFLVLFFIIYFITGSFTGYNLPLDYFEFTKDLNSVHIETNLFMKGLIFSNIILAMLVVDRVLLAQFFRKDYRV